jgi:glutamate/tyrosine decarboxylase-like PLP-dependent enzyme
MHINESDIWHPPAAQLAPDPAAALFPERGERARIDAMLSTALATLDARIADGPVTPVLDMQAFRGELEAFDFAQPQPLDEALSWIIARLERGLVQVSHPRYFGLFNPAPSFAAQCADRVAAAFNPQLASATTSPAAVALEAHVIRAVAARAGLPAATTGHFTSGGSEANCTALICALTAAHPEFAHAGARCFAGPPRLYVSREAHLAWIKIAHEAGIGRSAVRLVATDGHGRMDAPSLSAAIAADRAQGAVPVMVAATAGTTGAGMIDPLDACADIAGEGGLWFHVDAAWGGALIASPRHAGLLAGMERAHSLTIDAHKWFATTMGCGMFLVRDPAILSAAFHVATSFMPSMTGSVDPYLNSMQWSRRFLGLRLFLALAAAGWGGYARHVEGAIRRGAELAEALREAGWRIVNDPLMAVLCIEAPAGSADPATIVRRVLAGGAAWISTTSFEGRTVIRACICNAGATTRRDVAILVRALQEARQPPG